MSLWVYTCDRRFRRPFLSLNSSIFQRNRRQNLFCLVALLVFELNIFTLEVTQEITYNDAKLILDDNSHSPIVTK